MDDERWVQYWASRFRWALRPTIDMDDLKQTIRMAIWQAKKAYNASRGTWAYYSAYFIKNEIRRLIGRQTPIIESLDAPFSADNDLTLHDIVPDASLPASDAALIEDDSRRIVHDAVDGLPDQQREVITKRFFDGMTMPQVASEMQLTPGRCHTIYETARRRLRHNRALRALAYELAWQPYTVSRFNRTRESVVEWAIITAEARAERMKQGWTSNTPQQKTGDQL